MSKSFIFHSIILVSVITLASAELKLGPFHRDEPAEYTFEHRFSLDNALSFLKRVHGSLQSFRDLTEEAREKISQDKLKKIGNTDWETQNLGFPNQVKSIEGTLRKQDYQIKKLQFQLIQEQTKQGTGKKEELGEAQKAYERAEQSFREFWDELKVKD